jgi:hypothetical protein
LSRQTIAQRAKAGASIRRIETALPDLGTQIRERAERDEARLRKLKPMSAFRAT